MTIATLPPPTMDAETFCRQSFEHPTELVRGIVRHLPMPDFIHGKICWLASLIFGNFVETKRLGHMAVNDSYLLVERDPDTVRGMDLCFISFARLPEGTESHGPLTVAPELVIEVKSPSNTWSELFHKVGEYLDAGVTVVLILDAATKSATLYRRDTLQQTFYAEDELTIPDLLPEFSVSVAKFFPFSAIGRDAEQSAGG